jgi:FkbM family methyltransferase
MLGLPGDMYITRSLLELGEYSHDEVDLLKQIVKPGMTVIDIGANIGAIALPLAQACFPGPLYAFEPQQRIFQLLCANLALNQIKNALTFPLALGASFGVGAVPPIDYDRPGNFGGVSLSTEGLLIRIETLDSFELPSCHLIKVDVEGMEAEALLGAAETITRCRPILYVENDRADKQQILIDLIETFGYNQYWHVSYLGSIFPNEASFNMLCIPKESAVVVDGFEKINPLDWKSPGRLTQ